MNRTSGKVYKLPSKQKNHDKPNSENYQRSKRMNVPVTIQDIEQLIINQTEENISLDYKAGEALQNTDPKKKEIAKDVSAMANSAGGIIIYGIKEYDTAAKKHLPEKITPISRTEFSKEQLEQIIHGNISPRIADLRIHPITMYKQDEVVYVVEIPQSHTAHQNTRDLRYYRRNNFQAEPMQDYEIRDIMNRQKNPRVGLLFEIMKVTYEEQENPLMPHFPSLGIGNDWIENRRKKIRTIFTLKIATKNNGSVVAHYINYFVRLPEDIVDEERRRSLKKIDQNTIEYYGENTFRDIVDKQSTPFGSIPKYGPSRFVPVLPTLSGLSEVLPLFDNPTLDDRIISWTVYADNAEQQTGSIALQEIPMNIINEVTNE